MSVCIVFSVCSSFLCVCVCESMREKEGDRDRQMKRELILTPQTFISPWGLHSLRGTLITHFKNADVVIHSNTHTNHSTSIYEGLIFTVPNCLTVDLFQLCNLVQLWQLSFRK